MFDELWKEEAAALQALLDYLVEYVKLKVPLQEQGYQFTRLLEEYTQEVLDRIDKRRTK